MGGKAALILVMGFGVIFGYIGFRLNELESRAMDNTANYFEITSSHNFAVSGANIGLATLYQDTLLWNLPMGSSHFLAVQFFEPNPGPFGRGYYMSELNIVNPETMRVSTFSAMYPYRLEDYDRVEIYLKNLGYWDILGVMVGFPGSDDTWITLDSMWGRAYFNGNILVYGTPVYNNKVSTAKAFVPMPGIGTNQAIFKDGYETGVSEVPLPQVSDSADTFPFADTTLPGPVSILFRRRSPADNDGEMLIWSGLHNFSGGPSINIDYNLLPRKVVLVDGDVSVQGVIDGRVTIAARGRITIDDNLTYALDPRVNILSNDMLGLVALGDIEVYAPPSVLPSIIDRNVQAVMASLGGMITTNYTDIPANWTGVFRNFGAVISRSRTSLANYKVAKVPPPAYIIKGWYRRFRWDPRLGAPWYMRPPSFPIPEDLKKKLQIYSWWENVRVPKY